MPRISGQIAVLRPTGKANTRPAAAHVAYGAGILLAAVGSQ